MRIPIIAPLENHISTQESVDEYVHPTLSEKYNRMRYLSYEFGRHLHMLGIVTRPESIRGQRKRCVCPKTFLHAAGVDHALAREIVGHDSETSHQLYIRPSDDQRKEAMEKLSEMIAPSQSTKAIHSDISDEEMVFITKACAESFLSLDQSCRQELVVCLQRIGVIKRCFTRTDTTAS